MDSVKNTALLSKNCVYRIKFKYDRKDYIILITDITISTDVAPVRGIFEANSQTKNGSQLQRIFIEPHEISRICWIKPYELYPILKAEAPLLLYRVCQRSNGILKKLIRFGVDVDNELSLKIITGAMGGHHGYEPKREPKKAIHYRKYRSVQP